MALVLCEDRFYFSDNLSGSALSAFELLQFMRHLDDIDSLASLYALVDCFSVWWSAFKSSRLTDSHAHVWYDVWFQFYAEDDLHVAQANDARALALAMLDFFDVHVSAVGEDLSDYCPQPF